MKTQELMDLVRKGIFPVIQFYEEMEDQETAFDENMRGRLISFMEKEDGLIEFKFEIKEFEEYNIPFMKPAYYDKQGNPTLKVIETNFYPQNGIEEAYFYPQDEFPGSIVEENKLMVKYKASGSKDSYQTWLEKIIMDNQDAWVELETSLKNDIPTLEDLKADKSSHDVSRLGGKVEGVRHALERIRTTKQIFSLGNQE